jgi:hypothetical protein
MVSEDDPDKVLPLYSKYAVLCETVSLGLFRDGF